MFEEVSVINGIVLALTLKGTQKRKPLLIYTINVEE
jgi:hypothetical protein